MNGYGNSLLNHPKKCKQSDRVSYHRFEMLKRVMEQTGKYLQQDSLKSGILNSLKTSKLP